MLGRVKGFDSRYWDGNLPPGHGFEFYYAKATEGDSWLSPEFWGQWSAAQALGLKRGMYHFWRAAGNQPVQARNFADIAKAASYGDLPLVMDFEDTRAPKDKTTFVKMALFYDILRGVVPPEREIVIYTARWWWDTWVTPWLSKIVWNPYYLPLWEADPPPETQNPGEWTSNIIQQTELDVMKPGILHDIDVDWMDRAYWDELFPLQTWAELTPQDKDEVMQELAISHGLVRA